MKNLTLHTPSLLVGLGLAVLAGMAMSSQLAGSPSVEITRIVEPVAVQTPARPSDFVRIDQGVPYTVPAGRILVIQSSGFLTTESIQGGRVDIDGKQAFTLWGLLLQGRSHFDPGLIVDEGSVVEVIDNGGNPNTDGVVLAYLADK